MKYKNFLLITFFLTLFVFQRDAGFERIFMIVEN